MALVLVGLALWLAVPDVALANNCPSRALAEYGTCLKQNFGAGLALLGGALLAAGAAMAAAGGWLLGDQPPPPDAGPNDLPPEMFRKRDPDDLPREMFRKRRPPEHDEED